MRVFFDDPFLSLFAFILASSPDPFCSPSSFLKSETYTEVEGVRALANSIAGGKAVTFGSYDWDPEPEDLGIAISGSTSASLVDDEAKVAVSALTGGSSFTLGEATGKLLLLNPFFSFSRGIDLVPNL